MAKQPASARTVSTAERRRSALLHAVSKHTGKYATRAHLAPGAYSVKARVSGSVDGVKIDAETIEGTLAVEADAQRASTEAADPIRLTAYLLGHVKPMTAKQIFRELPKNWRDELAGVPDADVAAAKSLLEQLRFEGETKTINGAVKFLKAG